MQALILLAQLDTALQRELAPDAIVGYTSPELQQLYDGLGNLQRHRRQLSEVTDPIELSEFEDTIDFLANSQG